MRLFIAINLSEEIKDALMDIQDAMMDCGMTAGHISLMRSDRGKHGMVYTEL